jgi:hypothetical protein
MKLKLVTYYRTWPIPLAAVAHLAIVIAIGIVKVKINSVTDAGDLPHL